MKLSVVILNYNVRFFLEQCVISVYAALQHVESEIIVVDNNSSDDSCQMIKSRFPKVKLVENKENYGFPKGNNSGVALAQGEYVCILNPDTVVAEDTFSKVLAFAERQTNLGIIGCRLIDGTGNFLPESKRGIPTPWVAFTKIFGLYTFFPKSNYFNQYYAQHVGEHETAKVSILVGAFMVMKTNLYREIGGFDENCFMYSDDIDLSYMVLQKGKANFYFPETTIIHYKGESTVKDEKYMKRFQQAMNFFYRKHFKVSSFFSLFMKIGIVFFSLMKKNQGKSKQNSAAERYILISENETFGQKLEQKLKKSVALQHIENEKLVFSQTFSDKVQTELVFDNANVTFKDCIYFMESYKSKQISFKIHPKATNFLIGSNNKNDRGEVIIVE